jgi:hypothetical protein
MTVGDTDAAVHAWMVGKNADRARPTIVVCSTAVDFRVEARRLLKGRVAKYNFGVMTVGTRLSRESGPSIFLDRKRSNVLPSLAYGIPICVNLGGRSATIGGEIRLDSERYGVTVAHVFDEGDWDTSPDEDIIDLEFDEYSDDDWNDSEASFDEHHHGSPTHNKDVRFTEDSKLESELKEAYYVLSKHPTFIRKSTSQLIGRLEDPPKLHRPHDWALIKLDAPDGIDNGPSTSSLGTGVSSVPFGSASYMRSNVVRLGSDFIEAEAFAAGVVAATFVQDRSSPTLDGNEEFHNWPAKLSDDPIAVKAFATGVVAATECLLVSQTEQSLSSNNEDNAYVQPAMQNSALPHSDTTLRAPSQASHSLQGDDVAENLGQEDSMRSDDMRTQDVHDRFFRNPASIHPLAHIPPLEPSLADLHTRAQPMVALRYLPKIKDVRKSIQPGLKTEDIEDNHVLPTEAETRRAIAIPCRYTRMMLDETVWIATGRGALLKGRGVPSTCILNMHSQGFVEAFVVSLVDDASE